MNKKSRNNIIRLRILKENNSLINRFKNFCICILAGYTGTENRIIKFHKNK